MTSMSVAPQGDYLTTKQVAKRLGSTTQHVRQLIRAGHLTAIDIAKGGIRPRFRIPQTSLDEFERNAVVTTAEEVA